VENERLINIKNKKLSQILKIIKDEKFILIDSIIDSNIFLLRQQKKVRRFE